MAQGKRPDPEREARWREALARQGRSGLNVQAFCQREGMPESAFYAWRQIIRKRDAQRQRTEDVARPAFVALRVRAEEGRDDGGHIAIELRGGRVMRLPASMAPAQLAAVVRAIEEAA